MRKLAGGRHGLVQECVPARLIITRLILHFLCSNGSFLRKFHAQSQNTVDDVVRSVSCRVMRTGIVRALIALATSDQATPTTQMGLDGLLLLENVTRARNRGEIA